MMEGVSIQASEKGPGVTSCSFGFRLFLESSGKIVSVIVAMIGREMCWRHYGGLATFKAPEKAC